MRGTTPQSAPVLDEPLPTEFRTLCPKSPINPVKPWLHNNKHEHDKTHIHAYTTLSIIRNVPDKNLPMGKNSQNSFNTAWKRFRTSSSGMSFSILARVAARDMCLVKSFEYWLNFPSMASLVSSGCVVSFTEGSSTIWFIVQSNPTLKSSIGTVDEQVN